MSSSPVRLRLVALHGVCLADTRYIYPCSPFNVETKTLGNVPTSTGESATPPRAVLLILSWERPYTRARPGLW